MKSALRLVGEVCTINSRVTASSTPIIATLRARPGAATRRFAPCRAQAWARYGFVSASDSSPYSRTMSPARAWPHAASAAAHPARPLVGPDACSACAADAASGTPFFPEQDAEPGLRDAQAGLSRD